MTLGKGLGGGVPLGALVAHRGCLLLRARRPGRHVQRQRVRDRRRLRRDGGGRQPGFLQQVTQTGIYLTAHLEALSRKHGSASVRGQGLLLALDLKRNIGPAVAAKALERGLLINAPRPDSLRFMPALNVTRDEIDQMIWRAG